MTDQNQLVMYRPSDWDTITGGMEVDQQTFVVNNPPEWLRSMYQCFMEAQDEIKDLKPDVFGHVRLSTIRDRQLKTQYDALYSGIMDVYEMIQQKKNVEKEFNQVKLSWIAAECQNFGKEFYTEIMKVKNSQQDLTKAMDIYSKKQNTIEVFAERVKTHLHGMEQHWSQTMNQQRDAYNANLNILARDLEQMAQQNALVSKQMTDAIEERALLRQEMQQKTATTDKTLQELNQFKLRTEEERRLAQENKAKNEEEFASRIMAEVQLCLQRGERLDTKSVLESVNNPGPRRVIQPQPPSREEYSNDDESLYCEPVPDPPRHTALLEQPEDEDDVQLMLAKALSRVVNKDVTEDFLARLLSKTSVDSTPRGTVKEAPIRTPETFDGEDLTVFRGWWRSVEEYLHIKRARFHDDLDKIYFLGSLLKKRARSWHQARQSDMERLRVSDNWKGYSDALKEQFIDKQEDRRDLQRMKQLRYNGNIDDYMLRLKELNGRVNAQGLQFQDLVMKAMPSQIVEMVYNRHGKIPEEDTELLATLQEAGHVIELKKQDEALRTKKDYREVEKITSRPMKSLPSRDTGRNKPSSRPDRQDKRPERKSAFPSKGQPVGEKIWMSGRDALEGVPQAEIDRHKRENADCWRCGKKGHKMHNCYCKQTVAGTPLRDAPRTSKDTVSATKRKRDFVPVMSGALPPNSQKRAKVAAVQDEDKAMTEAPPIWVRDSSEESDF